MVCHNASFFVFYVITHSIIWSAKSNKRDDLRHEQLPNLICDGSGLTLSERANITSDITMLYISNLIFGSYAYKNQFNLSASIRKKIWGKKASITIGVDDILHQ